LCAISSYVILKYLFAIFCSGVLSFMKGRKLTEIFFENGGLVKGTHVIGIYNFDLSVKSHSGTSDTKHLVCDTQTKR